MIILTYFASKSRLRTDKGGENNEVGRLMIEKRGEGRGSWLRGRSTSNQRIERWWREMRTFCLQIYIDLFREFESTNMLNIDDPADLYALHYVYQPIINQALQNFIQAYNNHRIRTESNRTPLQIFTQRFFEMYESSHTYITEVIDSEYTIDNFDEYGVEPNEQNQGNDDRDDEPDPVLANANLMLDQQAMLRLQQELNQTVPNVLEPTDDHARGMYQLVRQVVHIHAYSRLPPS